MTGVVDRSERGKLALTGAQAAEALDALVTNDVRALAPGAGCYAAVLTNKGKMLGDLRVLRTEVEGRDGLWLDTERVALQAVFDVIRHGIVGWEAQLHKRTLQQALLSVVGELPEAAGLARAEHASTGAELAGRPVLLVRTPLGVDVVCAAEDAGAVRGAIALDDLPEAEAERLRVEAGRPRYGVDLDDTVIPEEAGLNDRAVSFTKGCYPGQETVARLHYRGKPTRHLRGLRLAGPVAPGTVVLAPDGGRELGRTGSVAASPALGPIALALLRREVGPGDEVVVGDGVSATVSALPFG